MSLSSAVHAMSLLVREGSVTKVCLGSTEDYSCTPPPALTDRVFKFLSWVCIKLGYFRFIYF